MAEVVSVDKAGRLVIPKSIRDSLGITERSRFILAEGENGRLLLQKVDLDEIADRLQRDLKKKNIDAIVKRVRKEINDKVKRKYKKVLA